MRNTKNNVVCIMRSANHLGLHAFAPADKPDNWELVKEFPLVANKTLSESVILYNKSLTKAGKYAAFILPISPVVVPDLSQLRVKKYADRKDLDDIIAGLDDEEISDNIADDNLVADLV